MGSVEMEAKVESVSKDEDWGELTSEAVLAACVSILPNLLSGIKQLNDTVSARFGTTQCRPSPPPLSTDLPRLLPPHRPLHPCPSMGDPLHPSNQSSAADVDIATVLESAVESTLLLACR